VQSRAKRDVVWEEVRGTRDNARPIDNDEAGGLLSLMGIGSIQSSETGLGRGEKNNQADIALCL